MCATQTILSAGVDVNVVTFIHLFLQSGSKPLGETSGSFALYVNNEKNNNVQ